jgi:hypothetical protein
MLLNRKICCAVIVAVLLSGCASVDFTPIGSSGSTARFTPIGSTALSPLPPNYPVRIYYSEKEVATPFRVVGTISYRNPGSAGQPFLFPDAVPDLEDLARKAGANGIIIDELVVSESNSIKSYGATTTSRTPFRAEARAIRVGQ